MTRLSVIDRVEVLRSVDFFSGAPGRIIAAVADQADEVELADGATLMQRGDEGDEMYVVVEGRLAVDVGPTRVNELGPGAVVGELAVLVPEPRTATVVALGPCLLLRLRTAVMDELLLDYPEIAVGIIRSLVRRFQEQSWALDEPGDR